jgi:DNA-binding transcriptional MerR regulator
MAPDLMRRYEDNEPIFTRSVAAELAHISIEFLQECEQMELVVSRGMLGGSPLFSRADIRRLERIRRLHEDLGLEMEMVEIVLHMRQQVVGLLRQMDELERSMHQREQQLLGEIQALRRRVSEETDWR